jgi:hypothetical protein
VRITNLTSGAVRYCRTANHSTTVSGVTRPAMGVATGGTIVDTQVTLPGDLALGEAQLVVVANGIPSDPVKVVVRPVSQARTRKTQAKILLGVTHRRAA